MKTNNCQIHYFDSLRDKFLAALYSENEPAFDQSFLTLKKALTTNQTLAENSLKSLYQINTLAKKFKKQKLYKYLNKFLKKFTRAEIKNPCIIDYDTWKTNLGIDDKTLKILFSTTINFQLSTGCSNYCRRCNEWALPGIRKHFSFDAIIKISQNLAKQNNKEYALYSASDPLDWKEKNKNIIHLINTLSEKNLIPSYGMLTKVPKGKESIFKKLIEQKTDISASITSCNRDRIKKIENLLSIKIDKQHDTDDLLIPAGRDEDFCTIKSSITDSYGTEITPDGAFIVAPTFTSSLNPTGQKRIPINKDTEFFIEKMPGTKGLKFNYFDKLKVINKNNKKYSLCFLLDSQIENILLDNGDYDLTQPGMISLKEYFETFKPKAVKIRKNMLPAIKKRLAEQYSPKEYTKQLKSHEYACDQNHVNKIKQQSLKSFLVAIKNYLKKNNSKRLIILYLRQKEINKSKNNDFKFNTIAKIKQTLQNPESDTFQLFTQLIFMLLKNPDNSIVKTLLN